ncbi:MAG: class I SAM-dependent methyltransferase [Fuerstiella sp.]|nr:class I SAM-dependent methyltransferase [Fuerstiella sp.]
MKTEIPCDLCGRNIFDRIADRDRDNRPLDTVICTNCGLVRHADVPSEEDLATFYSGSYREEYNGEKTPGPRRVMRAWLNGERICRQISSAIPAGAKILEVGAGIGCTVKVFEQAGFRAEGIDPGGEFLTYSRERLRANVTICSLDDLPGTSQFDAVLLIHVIEHLRSPVNALRRIAGLLKPDGLLYVECPNLQAPFASRRRLFHYAHIHNLVPETLQQFGAAGGFELQQRFGDGQDPNLQMLFRKTSDVILKTDPLNAQRTLKGLRRTDFLPYHLRARYMIDRVRKVSSYAREQLRAQAFVERLIDNCSGSQIGSRAA